MEITVKPEDSEVVSDMVDATISALGDAKTHAESCKSVNSVKMLTEVVADYDYRIKVLQDIKGQLEAQKDV